MPETSLELCVLASGSRGNCSVLRLSRAGTSRLVLVDLGLSPLRTRAHLANLGHSLADVDTILFTHLDADHAHVGWSTTDALPSSIDCFVPKPYLGRAQRSGLKAARLMRFHAAFQTRSGLYVQPHLCDHDALGSAAFRFHFEQATLGYATDLGTATDQLTQHLRDVAVLAIESNYCPQRQLESSRPDFLKRRIMGGRGHLSNQQSADAIRQINPQHHVVLLHLSQQCNDPALAASHHRAAHYTLTISAQNAPTPWITVPTQPHLAPPLHPRMTILPEATQGWLFSDAAATNLRDPA